MDGPIAWRQVAPEAVKRTAARLDITAASLPAPATAILGMRRHFRGSSKIAVTDFSPPEQISASSKGRDKTQKITGKMQGQMTESMAIKPEFFTGGLAIGPARMINKQARYQQVKEVTS